MPSSTVPDALRQAFERFGDRGERASSGRRERHERREPEEEGLPDYRLPPGFVLRWLATALLSAKRDAAADGHRLLRGREPRPRAEGVEHIPPDGPVVLVMNHYERRGLRVWWPALLVSAVVGRRRGGEVPPVRWLITDRFYRMRIAGIRVPDGAIRWLLRKVASTYGLILVPRNESQRGLRSRALREADAALRPGTGNGAVVGITPEAARGFGRELVRPGRNAGPAIAWLAREGVPVLPVAVFEDEGGALVARFGPRFRVAHPERELTRESRDELTDQVMRQLAALMPPGLRGAYAGGEPGEQPASGQH